MTKREKVKLLDDQLLEAMLKAVSTESFELLPLMSTAIQYVKANEETLEKEKDTEEDENKRRVREANARRKTKV